MTVAMAGSCATQDTTTTPCTRRTNNQAGDAADLRPTEVFGGLASRAAAALKFYARRSKNKKQGRDSTKYSGFHPGSDFLSHHLADIVSAVVLTDASHIDDGVTALKQRVTALPRPARA